MSIAILFDTETHDNVEPQIIEATTLEIAFGYPTEPGIAITERFRPSKRIALGALATHHILDEDLVDCRKSAEYELPPCQYLIGHNIDFDWAAAGGPDTVNRIDTCSMARRIWPGLDSYSQSALLYHLDRANARERLKNAHSASADVLICKTILDAIITATAVESWADLYELSEEYRIPERMPFGKHDGMLIEELPPSYTQWLLKLPDLDPYLRKAIAQKGQGQQNLF